MGEQGKTINGITSEAADDLVLLVVALNNSILTNSKLPQNPWEKCVPSLLMFVINVTLTVMPWYFSS